MVPTRLEAVTLLSPDPFPVRSPACKTPPTVNDVKVPTDVMLVWAATVTLWAVLTVLTFDPFMFEIPEPLEAIKSP